MQDAGGRGFWPSSLDPRPSTKYTPVGGGTVQPSSIHREAFSRCAERVTDELTRSAFFPVRSPGEGRSRGALQGCARPSPGHLAKLLRQVELFARCDQLPAARFILGGQRAGFITRVAEGDL